MRQGRADYGLRCCPDKLLASVKRIFFQSIFFKQLSGVIIKFITSLLFFPN